MTKIYTDVRYENRVEKGETKNGRVYFHSQGGGFVHSVTLAQWKQHFRPATKLAFAPAKVTGEWLDEGMKFDCYMNGDVWNGWAMPYFTKAVAERVMEQQNATDGLPAMHYDKKLDAFVVGGDEVEVYEGEEITVEGKKVTVYGIGTGSWVWEKA